MNILKKIAAAILVGVMALSVVGCHKKNEIAVTINGFEFTSAYYMCTLINANMEAQSKVQESLSADESTEEINYFSKKIDGKKYETWVKDRAIEMLKEIATYKSLCKDAKITLDDDSIASAQYLSSYYWESYGYSQFFEPNGVGQNTFETYMTDSYYSNRYFEHLYGKDGEKEIAEKDVEDKLYGNFIIADVLEVTFSQETDDEKAEIKKQFEEYEKALKNNKKAFEEIYKEYNNVEDEEDKEDNDEESKPVDEYATILGAKDSGYDHDYYKTIKKMDTNEIKLIKKDSDAGYLLVVKKDIKADPYYLEYLDSTVRHLIKDSEFEKDIENYAKDLKAEINKYAVNQFKVKKIKELS